MSTQLQTFTFTLGEIAHAIRVVLKDDGPWFNAGDICAILDFGNSRQAVDSHVDQDDVQRLDVIDNIGRTQAANHVNEPGLYSLILGSRKPEAKPFKRWVTHEVLPAIARTGIYADAGNRMGETLGQATGEQIHIERDPVSLELAQSVQALAGLVAGMQEALRGATERSPAP